MSIEMPGSQGQDVLERVGGVRTGCRMSTSSGVAHAERGDLGEACGIDPCGARAPV